MLSKSFLENLDKVDKVLQKNYQQIRIIKDFYFSGLVSLPTTIGSPLRTKGFLKTFEHIYEMQQVTMSTKNTRKNFD